MTDEEVAMLTEFEDYITTSADHLAKAAEVILQGVPDGPQWYRVTFCARKSVESMSIAHVIVAKQEG